MERPCIWTVAGAGDGDGAQEAQADDMRLGDSSGLGATRAPYLCAEQSTFELYAKPC